MENMTVGRIAEAVGGRLLCGEASLPVEHISIDSRKILPNSLFVPLIGEKVDAHRFLKQAIELGAAAVFTSEHEEAEDPSVPWIRVDDTKKALQRLGAFCRQSRPSLPVVAVTGSVGKTTTREMIAVALSAKYEVYKTPGNHNSQVGVPITLSEISSKDEIAVIELGMSERGELSVIAKMAEPDMAVITNIGVTHIEQLGSIMSIYAEKMSIQDGLRKGGKLFLNVDDPFLWNTKARKDVEVVYYGKMSWARYQAGNIHLEDGYPVFTLYYKEREIKVKLGVLGEHNVYNALAALAVAGECGVNLEAAARALEQFRGFANRQQLYQVGGLTIFDDSYNASPVSMKAAIEVLANMKGKRRIAVLADMKELGEQTEEFHYDVGKFAAQKNLDFVITCGELARQIAKAVLDAEKMIQVVSFSDNESLLGFLRGLLHEGDCVLFKGSNSMKLFEVCAQLRKEKEEA